MAGTNLGTAYISIMPSTKGMSSALSSQMESEGNAAGSIFGSSMAGKLVKVIAASGAVAAVTKFFKDAIDEGAKLQQSFGGIDTIYGEAAEGMKEMAYQASQAGISANDYAEQAVSFGAALKQAWDGDVVSAAKQADEVIMDIADNSAKMGTDIGSVTNAFQGIAKQNYTMLDNLKLGYGGTKQEMERLLKDATALTGVEYNIDNVSDVYEAIHAVQQELGITGVAAQEGAETFSGSMAAMKASAKNLLANLSLGEDISEPLKTLLESTRTFLVDNLFPMIGNVIKQLPGLIGEALLWAFDNIPNMIDSAITFINNLANGISENSGAFKEKLVEIGKAALEMFKNIDWAGLGKAVLNLLWEGIKAIGSTLWEGLKGIGQTAADWFQDVDWVQVGKDVIEFIWTGLGKIGSWIWEKLKSLGQIAKTKFTNIDWLQLGKDVIKFIWEGLGAIGSWIWEKLKALGQTAKTQVKNIDWLQLGKDVITFIWNGLTELGSTIWEKLKEIGGDAVEEFKNIDWKQLGIDIINFIVEGIWSVGSAIWEGLGSIGKKALDWITGNDSGSGIDWGSVGDTIVNEISASVMDSTPTLQSASDYMASVLATAMYGRYYDYYNVGQNIVAGVVEGMQSYFYVAQQMAIGLANMVTSALTGFGGFMIGSPSKRMRDEVGRYIPAGIAEGIEQNMGVLDRAVDDIVKSTVSDFDMDMAHNVSLSGGELNRAETSPITINVYPSAGMDERGLADKVQQQLALAQRQRLAAWGTA